jgi:uncharacterized membrane protein
VSRLVYAGLSAFFDAPIDRLSGGVTLVLAALLLHERAPASAWFGTALMLIGAVIVARS